MGWQSQPDKGVTLVRARQWARSALGSQRWTGSINIQSTPQGKHTNQTKHRHDEECHTGRAVKERAGELNPGGRVQFSRSLRRKAGKCSVCFESTK